VTHDEVIDLLTLIAASDKRTVGQADVEVWHAVATADAWTFSRARHALIEHLRHNDAMVTPAHINKIIDTARQRARAKLIGDINPPRDLADDPHAEIAWRRQHTTDYIEAALEAWAHGHPMPDHTPDPAPALAATDRPQLEAIVAMLANRHQVTRGGPSEPADPNDSAARLDAARAELDAIRTAPAPADSRPVQSAPEGETTP
jgi:hypothetical protein